MDIQTLTERFGLSRQLHFSSTENGIVIAEVNTPLCHARIALQGAQLFEWTPSGEEPVIWLSSDAVFVPGKSLRGGVPVCWPWFGAHSTGTDFPAHGFARTVPWRVCHTEALPDGRIRLDFHMEEGSYDLAWWPYDCELELHMTLGQTLELELITRNNGTQTFDITEALHTYFAVSDIRQVRVLGLDGFDYLDKVLNFARQHQSGAIQFTEEVDRVYLDSETRCVIEDIGLARQIMIDKRGSRSTVVWNPWQAKSRAMGDMGKDGYLSMLCVETANAASNQVSIQAGEEHRLWLSYGVES